MQMTEAQKQLVARIRREITLDPGWEAQAPESVQNSKQPVMTSGQPWSIEIDRVGVLTKLEMRVAVTISTGATPGTPTARTRNPVESIGNIGFSINGQPNVNISADLLFCTAQYMRGNLALGIDSITSAELAAGSTTPGGSVTIPLDLCFPDASVPQTGALPTGDSGTLTLSGTTVGGVSSIMDSAGATQAISAGPSVAVLVTRIRPQRISRIGYGAYVTKFQTVVVPTTTTQGTVYIPGGYSFLGLAIRSTTGSTGAASDAVFTAGYRMQVYLDSTLFYDRYAQDVIDRTAQRFPAATPRTGFYYLDFCREYANEKLNLAKARPTPNGKNLTFQFAATAGANTQFELVPIAMLGPVQARTLESLPVPGQFIG